MSKGGGGFRGLREGELTFKMTDTFDPRTDTYGTSTEARAPSWTGGVLRRGVDVVGGEGRYGVQPPIGGIHAHVGSQGCEWGVCCDGVGQRGGGVGGWGAVPLAPRRGGGGPAPAARGAQRKKKRTRGVGVRVNRNPVPLDIVKIKVNVNPDLQKKGSWGNRTPGLSQLRAHTRGE